MARSKFFAEDCLCPPVWDCPRHQPKGLDRATASPVRPNPNMRRAPLKQKSDKQDARDNGWNRALVYVHLVLGGPPFACGTCGKVVGSDIIEALNILQPGHVEERRHDPGKGVRFYANGKVKQIGTDTFDNVQPQCADCNLAQHLKDIA